MYFIQNLIVSFCSNNILKGQRVAQTAPESSTAMTDQHQLNAKNEDKVIFLANFSIGSSGVSHYFAQLYTPICYMND